MSNIFTVFIDVEVDDENALYEQAMYHAIHNDGMSRVEAEGMLSTDADPDDLGKRDVNVRACLQMLLDPGTSPSGCSILHSTVGN